MNGSQLGKIQEVKLGFGGYQEVMFGVSFTLGGSGWGVRFYGEAAVWGKGVGYGRECVGAETVGAGK